MSDFLTPNSMIMLQQAMSFQWAKQRAISDNIVNAETPNYKVKYVTFEEALRKNIQAAAQDRNAAPSAMRQTLEAAAPQVRVAGDERARMDENGVNVAEQHIELVRSAYQIGRAHV